MEIKYFAADQICSLGTDFKNDNNLFKTVFIKNFINCEKLQQTQKPERGEQTETKYKWIHYLNLPSFTE